MAKGQAGLLLIIIVLLIILVLGVVFVAFLLSGPDISNNDYGGGYATWCAPGDGEYVEGVYAVYEGMTNFQGQQMCKARLDYEGESVYIYANQDTTLWYITDAYGNTLESYMDSDDTVGTPNPDLSQDMCFGEGAQLGWCYSQLSAGNYHVCGVLERNGENVCKTIITDGVYAVIAYEREKTTQVQELVYYTDMDGNPLSYSDAMLIIDLMGEGPVTDTGGGQTGGQDSGQTGGQGTPIPPDLGCRCDMIQYGEPDQLCYDGQHTFMDSIDAPLPVNVWVCGQFDFDGVPACHAYLNYMGNPSKYLVTYSKQTGEMFFHDCEGNRVDDPRTYLGLPGQAQGVPYVDIPFIPRTFEYMSS
jgi:hypothetical protein